MIDSTTLLVRHMAPELSHEEKEQFLRHFGAINVKIIQSKHKKSSTVYAAFESHDAAEAALKHLHQTDVLGHLLAVEFARVDYGCNFNTTCSDENNKSSSIGEEKKPPRYYENFLYRLNNWTAGLDFNMPPPVHLKYQYPPPTRSALENILKTLATVPKFYNQVLHLMNKMNLPCPFTDDFPIESSILSDYEIVKKSDNPSNYEGNILMNVENVEVNVTSDDESEIESDGDEDKLERNPVLPLKRQLPDKKKRVKRPKFIKPAVNVGANKMNAHDNKNVLTTEDVFEKATEKDQIQTRKIEVKITPDLSSIQEAEETQKSISAVEGFEKLPVSENVSNETVVKTNLITEEEENVCTCVTELELASNRISARDQRILPVFKNYQPGAPSCRLYLKNLAKQVTARDLHYIYRRYLILDNHDDQGTMFDVRLMQEGRMKGQAFVNLQSVEIAQKALKETNGFILKDKPMVVQFARSSKAKEAHQLKS